MAVTNNGSANLAFLMALMTWNQRQRLDELLLLVEQRRTRVDRTGLDGESTDDAVKRHAVEYACLREPQEIPHMPGCLVRHEPDRDRTRAGFEHRLVLGELFDRFG
jgi:hypothetical protein